MGFCRLASISTGSTNLHGSDAYSRFPTLLWLSSSDLTLTALCWLGAALSALLMAGVAPVPVLGCLWSAISP